MATEGVDAAREGATMQRPRVLFDFNMGTILPLIIAGVGIVSYIKSLENQINLLDQRGAARIIISDKNYSDQQAINRQLVDIPYRVGNLEEGQKDLGVSVDQLRNLIISGQEAMRRDVQGGFDGIRKDLGGLSTQVEVLNSRFNDKPKAGVYRPR